MLDRLDKFHKTRTGYGLFALVELALAYLFMSWAINDGNWLDYLLAIIFLVGFLQNLVKLIAKVSGYGRR
jgi:type IV secretory pathway TrbL component